jgi:hypothetical protein
MDTALDAPVEMMVMGGIVHGPVVPWTHRLRVHSDGRLTPRSASRIWWW